MIFGKCSDCCKICCCLPGEGEGESYVDRTKSKRQCEQAGGTVVECPSIPQCPCICTPTVTMKNGAAVPILEDAFDILNAAEIGVIEPPTLVCTNGWAGTRWRFLAAASYSCFLLGYEVNWVRLVVWPQLEVFDGVNWQNLTAEYGQASIGYWFQDYFFPHQAAVGSGFPCPKNEAVLQYSSFPGHPGSDAPGLLCAARPDWSDELNTLAEAFFQPTLSLECDPYVENCAQPCALCDCTAAVSVNGVTLAPWSDYPTPAPIPTGSPCDYAGTFSGTTQVTSPVDPIFGNREGQAVSVTAVGPFDIDGGITINKFVVTATAYYGCDVIRVVVDSYFSRDAGELAAFYPNGLRSINGPVRIWQFSYANWDGTGDYFCPGGDYASADSCLFYSIPTNAEADCSASNPPVPGPNCPTIEWMTAVGAGDGLAVVDEMPDVALSCDLVQN